jgi:hypothetical protein
LWIHHILVVSVGKYADLTSSVGAFDYDITTSKFSVGMTWNIWPELVIHFALTGYFIEYKWLVFGGAALAHDAQGRR